MQGEGPTAHRIMLGTRLRSLREGQGISRSAAGYHIRASESKISRMELGRVGFKQRDVTDLLTLYGVLAESDRGRMLALARLANQPGWWHTFADVVPGWLEPYLGLESAATLIRIYQPRLVPDLLQTEDYAREVVLRTSNPASISPATVERMVSLRTARQRIFDRQDPPRLWAVVDESALLRRVGSSEVMRAQLKHLITLSERPGIVVQVVPTAYGAHLAEGGAFTILRFGAQNLLPDVVYLEQLTGMTCVERTADVDRYKELVNFLSIASIPPDRTAEHLVRLAACF